MQQAWKEGGGWNTPLGDELSRAAEDWWGEAETIEQLKYERWLKATPGESYSLRTFTDASEVAYGACVYLVSSEQSALICDKPKVAPVKLQTLARLEMQVTFLCSAAVVFVCKGFRVKIDHVHAWTDRATVWHLLQRPAYYWKTCVANRVASIQESSQMYNVV